jgi:hypothetical protein
MESVMLRDVSTVPDDISSGEPLTPPRPPALTVADLHQSLGPNSTRVIGGTTADADAEVLRNIVLVIKSDERRRLCWRLLLLFSLFPITFSWMLAFYMYYAQRMSGIEELAKGGIRHMIRLEGDQWSRYVGHIFTDSPRQMRKASTKWLLARGYGHLLLAPQGFLLDALLGMNYKNITVVHTEVIGAPNGVDLMLRAWFRKRIVVITTDESINMKNGPLKFDIFLPPQMSTEHITSLSNLIMLESTCGPLF